MWLGGISCQSVWGVIFQWGSTLKVRIELPATFRHCRDMTERLLKATLSPNKQTNLPSVRHLSFVSKSSQNWEQDLFQKWKLYRRTPTPSWLLSISGVIQILMRVIRLTNGKPCRCYNTYGYMIFRTWVISQNNLTFMWKRKLLYLWWKQKKTTKKTKQILYLPIECDSGPCDPIFPCP